MVGNISAMSQETDAIEINWEVPTKELWSKQDKMEIKVCVWGGEFHNRKVMGIEYSKSIELERM